MLTVLGDLARRAGALTRHADAHKSELERLIRSLDATLLEEPAIGPISAAKLLACDPHRLTGEAALARCNGTAPLQASSGKTQRHRLSRGGDRQANNAIHTITLSHSQHDPETRGGAAAPSRSVSAGLAGEGSSGPPGVRRSSPSTSSYDPIARIGGE